MVVGGCEKVWKKLVADNFACSNPGKIVTWVLVNTANENVEATQNEGRVALSQLRRRREILQS